jgi:hypothetical protein
VTMLANPFATANVFICEDVVKDGSFLNAIHVFNVITIEKLKQPRFKFKTLAYLTSQPGDTAPHSLAVQMERYDGYIAAYTTPTQFVFGYAIDPSGPGGYFMTTNFEIDAALYVPGNYAIVVYVDRQAVASAPLRLRIL